jgi:hypothetical protein
MLEEARAETMSRYKQEYQPSSYSRHRDIHRGVLSSAPADTRRAADKSLPKPGWEDKFQHLKAQRKARGECYKCGAKFAPGHKCNAIVPLNLVEELVELL